MGKERGLCRAWLGTYRDMDDKQRTSSSGDAGGPLTQGEAENKRLAGEVIALSLRDQRRYSRGEVGEEGKE